jgi:sugar O-acyltransferase (sialic acid O-acetyltransferase NeuD family)
MAQPPVIVLGAGGHAKVVIDLLQKLGRTVQAALEVAPPVAPRRLLGVPVEGEEKALGGLSPDSAELALGIGMSAADPIKSLATRRALAARYQALGFRFPALIHPGAIIGAECTLGDGAQVMAGTVLQAGSRVGAFAIINTGARVDHDCVLGEACHIAPGATLGGSVRVGAETLVGIGATVRQGTEIGERVLIAGGAMVIDNVPDAARRAGVPAQGDAR